MFDAERTKGLEYRSEREILDCQNLLLQEHIRYLAQHSPFYRRMFAENRISPQDIRTVSDLSMVPFTTKRDMELYNGDLFCTAESETVDICLTSGTTGQPVAVFQTPSDLERLAYNEEVTFRAAGVGRDDRVLIAAAIDRCFMAGLAYFMGLTRIGATVIRGGSSSLAVLMQMVRRFRPSTIVGVPTLMLTLADRLRQEGDDPASFGVRRLVCIGEPVRNPDLSLSRLGERLGKAWDGRVFGTYASTEMASTFGDCEKEVGGHIHPELIVVEIVDEDGRVLPPGQAGEVVATPLQVTGMPLLRFKTGDIATLHAEPCSCGRNSYRLGPVLGRKSQMLKYRGTTVYPPAIANVLQQLEAVRGYYIEVYDDYELSDRIRVVVGTEDASLKSSFVAERIAAAIRVKPEVILTSPQEVQSKTIQESKRKPVTFFDYRTLSGKDAKPERGSP